MSTDDAGTTVSHPIFARFFSALSSSMEDRGLGERRSALLDGLNGHVLEVGCGDGANFGHYPTRSVNGSVGGIVRLDAVEPERYLRAKARSRATDLRFPIEVHDATADALPLRDASVDAVVFCLVLCSVPDVGAALAEAHRVLKPGGGVRLLEHVAASGVVARGTQKALDATVWPALFGGCHTARDPIAALEEAGFEVLASERSRFPAGVPQPTSPHVHLRAVKR